MNIFLTVFMTICATVAIAQTRVMSKKDMPEKEQFAIANQYTASPSKENADEIMDKLDIVMANSLPKDPKPGIFVMFQTYVNGNGTLDYIFYDLENIVNYDKDSLNIVFRSSLAKAFNGFVLKDKPAAPFGVASYRMIGKAVVAREVRMSDSSITELKQAISFVDTLKIKKLFLNQIDLKEVPDVIYRFPNVVELYLGGNELETARIDVARLPKLEQLHLQGNRLTSESLILTSNKSLKVLNLNENKFEDIPGTARNCKGLTSLWLGGNKLTKLNNGSFRKFKKIKDLNFYKSGVAVLPKGVKKMRNLEVLDLYYNNLEELPKTIVKLKKLTHLAVSNNRLTKLPEKIDRLKNVHTLYAHHNHLSKLPERIVKMQKLKILDLGFNWFTDFPAELISFSGLEELDLSSNNFIDFPNQLLAIKRLDKLYLRGNPFVQENTEVKYGQQLSQLKGKNIEVFY